MINPGVIKLLSKRDLAVLCGMQRERFEIEDNIGEALHIHYSNIRMDFTVDEYKMLCGALALGINNFLQIDGFDINEFDPGFVAANAESFVRLKSIKKEKVLLSQLLIDTFDENGTPVIRSLKFSRVYKALNGNCEEDNNRVQLNRISNKLVKITNTERTEENLESIRKNGYPYLNKYIVLDGKTNRIIDGQHRAACLFFLYGDISVDVIKLEFKEEVKNDIHIDNIDILKEYSEKCEKIFLYGAGDWGRRLYYLMQFLGINVEGFVVSGCPEKSHYCKKRVYSASDASKIVTKNDGIIPAFEGSKNFDILGKFVFEKPQLSPLDFGQLRRIYIEHM